jgi:hypothetical protein
MILLTVIVFIITERARAEVRKNCGKDLNFITTVGAGTGPYDGKEQERGDLGQSDCNH